MRRPAYPFSAIAGQEQMKLALLLAATDGRLGVLLRGDKGSGKTTAARALATLLPEPAPFVNLPIGVTEDRLLGGIHLESTLQGTPRLKPGLLSEAHGGVLYIDEVNLLPAHLGDALLDAASSGVHIVEREGFSASHPAEFVLLGSMNPEEGLLRPQLVDRFALSVEIAAPLDAGERQAIVERRVAFEREPARFCDAWSEEEAVLRERVRCARERLASIECPGETIAEMSAAICAAGVRSLRADLAAVRAGAAYAALMGDPAVTSGHAGAVLPLVLGHRARAGGRSMPPSPPPPRRSQDPAPAADQGGRDGGRGEEGGRDQGSRDQGGREAPGAREARERVFAPLEVRVPAIPLVVDSPTRGGHAQRAPADHPGPAVAARRSASPREIDLRATLNHAVLETGTVQLRPADLHERVRESRAGIRYIFLIDSSGSHAAQGKMRLVKGAVLGMLGRSLRRDDEMVLIAFRGADAQVLLEPSRQLEDAVTALEYLPTGGRTPLAHALELAGSYVTPSALLVLVSDGRANVAVAGGDPWEEALERAGRLHCRALVVSTEDHDSPVRRLSGLADALRASLVDLGGLADLEAGAGVT